MIVPNRWAPEIEQRDGVAGPASIWRFVDIIMTRANAGIDPFTAAMSRRSKMAMRDWAGGFSYLWSFQIVLTRKVGWPE